MSLAFYTLIEYYNYMIIVYSVLGFLGLIFLIALIARPFVLKAKKEDIESSYPGFLLNENFDVGNKLLNIMADDGFLKHAGFGEAGVHILDKAYSQNLNIYIGWLIINQNRGFGDVPSLEMKSNELVFLYSKTTKNLDLCICSPSITTQSPLSNHTKDLNKTLGLGWFIYANDTDLLLIYQDKSSSDLNNKAISLFSQIIKTL